MSGPAGQVRNSPWDGSYSLVSLRPPHPGWGLCCPLFWPGRTTQRGAPVLGPSTAG